MSSKMKTLRKKALAHAEAGEKEEAKAAFEQFSSQVDRAAKKGLLHKNNAANQKSRVNASIKKAIA